MFDKNSLVGLLVLIGAIALFHFTFIVHEQQQEPPKREVSKSNFAHKLEVSPHAGKLCVTFFTQNPTRCRLGVGFSPRRQTFKESKEEWYGRQHILSVEGLSPGKIYFALSCEDQQGQSFEEQVRSVVLPSPVLNGTELALSTKEKTQQDSGGNPHESTEGRSAKALLSTTSTSVSSTSSIANENKGTILAQCPTVTTSAVSATLTATEGEGTLVASDDGYYEEENPFNKLPKADPSTKLGKRALSASKIDRSFGPASLQNNKREELLQKIEKLQKDYEDYDDAQGARQLAEAYLKLRDYRKALQYATAGVRHSPKDVGSHKIRLTVYKKFAMGWKVKETYQKLVSLCPGDSYLQKQYARDSKLFGNFKTIGKAQRVEIK
jgi:tetratricopeptide (TPR) repeat protein